jgi:hypothetical protein
MADTTAVEINIYQRQRGMADHLLKVIIFIYILLAWSGLIFHRAGNSFITSIASMYWCAKIQSRTEG